MLNRLRKVFGTKLSHEIAFYYKQTPYCAFCRAMLCIARLYAVMRYVSVWCLSVCRVRSFIGKGRIINNQSRRKRYLLLICDAVHNTMTSQQCNTNPYCMVVSHACSHAPMVRSQPKPKIVRCVTGTPAARNMARGSKFVPLNSGVGVPSSVP